MALNHIYLNKKTEAFVRRKKLSENESDAAAASRMLREMAEQEELRTKFDLREGK